MSWGPTRSRVSKEGAVSGEDRPGWVWPITIADGPVAVRPLRWRDRRAWRALRLANLAWLAPWEATQPELSGRPPGFGRMVRLLAREARAGRMLPLAVTYEGRLVGQITVSGIQWGSLRSGQIGYWVDHRMAGRGIIPTAVALVTDRCLLGLGLHRMEVNIRPENAASLRVVAKLGFREEGLRRRYLHISGTWCDHLTFALTSEELRGGLLARWHAVREDLARGRAMEDPSCASAPGDGHDVPSHHSQASQV